jgi:predicted nucleic acid-binding Zn ribbon protein
VSDEQPDGELSAAQVTRFSTADGGKQRSTVDSDARKAHESVETDPSSTDGRGQPVDNDPEPSATDLAQTALADARRMARGTPRRRDREQARRGRRDNPAARRTGGYSAPGSDPDRDPQPIGSLLAGYVDERGWDRPLAEARVFAEWAALVGGDVAAHCAPQSLNAGELRISAESTAWATQLRLLNATLLARLVAELGPQVVTKLVITGPTGPSWKHGGRSVRGARGPRDTYG